MKNNRVLMLLTNPFTNDSRVLKEGRSLVKAGYDVTLACYNYGDLPKSETVEGIKVRRIFYYKRKNLHKSMLSKCIAALFLFKYSLTVWLRYGKADIIHCNDLLTLPTGVLVKYLRFGKKKIIYDAHEYETEVNGLMGIRKTIYRFVEKSFIKHSDAMITVSNSIANEYVRLYNIKKPELVLNCPPYQNASPKNLFRERFSISDDVIIFLYQGALTPGRGVDVVLETFKNHPEPNKAVVFMGYGPLAETIQDAAKENSNIYFHEAVTPDVLLGYTSSADMGLCLIENVCLSYYYCLPNKLFEYTMAGLPVIVTDLFELSRVSKEYKNGIIIENMDVPSLQKAVSKINRDDLQRMKASIPEMKKTYNWEEQEKVLLRLYDNL